MFERSGLKRAAGFGKAQMRLGPARFKALIVLPRSARFRDPGKLSSIIPRKAPSIMCGESAADTCS
jgi:hypothetical protein